MVSHREKSNITITILEKLLIAQCAKINGKSNKPVKRFRYILVYKILLYNVRNIFSFYILGMLFVRLISNIRTFNKWIL